MDGLTWESGILTTKSKMLEVDHDFSALKCVFSVLFFPAVIMIIHLSYRISHYILSIESLSTRHSQIINLKTGMMLRAS